MPLRYESTGSKRFPILDIELLPVINRARSYLLRTQKEDGSWFVKSRSKPIQKFFDSGDPHGKDQFISMAATSWATAALAKAGLDQGPDTQE